MPLLGFTRSQHLLTWLLLAGPLIAFSLLRLPYLAFESTFCNPDAPRAAPGECLYFRRTALARLGIQMHLWCILPAGILAGLQFIPALRKRPFIKVHRVFGYASIILGSIGAVAVIPITRHSFGGDVAAQVVTGVAMVLFLGAQGVGLVCVRRGDVVRHRVWMLRAWFYASSIITLRIIMAITAISISAIGGYYLAMPCDKINFTLGSREETLKWYPECSPFYTEGDVSRRAIVDANVFGRDLMQLTAAFNMTYGMSAWLALFIHMIGIEIYIQSPSKLFGWGKAATKSS